MNKNTNLMAMRAAACFAIIVLHTVFAANEYFIDTINETENLISRIVENNMMWAVPLFVMVTGALQLNWKKELPIKKLYGKYVARILIALTSCCIIFRLFDMFMDGESISVAGFFKWIPELITADSWGHLWYLYLLIGLYVLLPFYRMIAERSSDREMYYLIGVYALFVSIIPQIEDCGVEIGFYISESIIYPLYLFIGHMVFSRRLKISFRCGVMLTALGTIVIVGMDFLKYTCSVPIPDSAFGYSSLAVIVQTTGVFAMMMNADAVKSTKAKAIRVIDECSFGIYLIHMIFVRLLFRYMGFNPYESFGGVCEALILFGIIIGFFLISFVIVWLLRKIPGISRVI